MGKRRVSVKVRNGDINRALKKFKRGVIDSGHIFELKDRKYHTKPTTRRRREKEEAIRSEEIYRLKNDDLDSLTKNKKKHK